MQNIQSTTDISRFTFALLSWKIIINALINIEINYLTYLINIK